MKKINYFYLLMVAISCMIALKAQDKPKEIHPMLPDSLLHKWECPSGGLVLNKPILEDTPKLRKLPLPSRTPQDTLKIPAYRIMIPVAEFNKMADTSNMVMEYYGIEKTGSEIMQNKIWMANQWNKLLYFYAKPDTIRVVKGGKP